MRKLILKMSISIDGFVGGPTGEIDWIFKSMDDTAAAWTMDTLRQAGAHLMGSRTFNDMASYWPYSTEPFAAPMNEIPKVVFSKKGLIWPLSETLTTAFKDASHVQPTQGIKNRPIVSPGAFTAADTKLITGDLAEEIKLLKQQPGKELVAHGGAEFAQSLVKTGLIDEYRLLVHPVALGKGLPLFSAISRPIDLTLVNAISFKSGAVAHIYRPA